MVSPTSLSAFSVGAAQPPVSETGIAQRVRTAGSQQPLPLSPSTPSSNLPTRNGEAAPGKPLPRGSLLDLSV